MAIEFKEIIDKRGYKVSGKDRLIFEREIGKGYFGLGISDMIEFRLFDLSDNPLPLNSSGDLVKYIFLNEENIRKYFLLTNNKSNKRENGADEYAVDIEKLITESGYSSGTFKTQVTLLNRRVGSEKIKDDKLWIHEISPSRTEIRLLPVKGKDEKIYNDLETRLNIILNNRNFRDDTIYFVRQLVESITVNDIQNTFLTIKGKVTTGENYINLIKQEFKIQDWNEFIKTIHGKFVESAIYFTENRDWNINSNNYGKQTGEKINIELSVSKIIEILNSILIQVIDKFLPRQDIQEVDILTSAERATFDELSNILKTLSSGNVFDTSNPNFRPPQTPPPALPPLPQVNNDIRVIFPEERNGVLISKMKFAWADSQVEYTDDTSKHVIKLRDSESIHLKYYPESFKVIYGDVRDNPKTNDNPRPDNPLPGPQNPTKVVVNPPKQDDTPVINSSTIFNGGRSITNLDESSNRGQFNPNYVNGPLVTDNIQ